MSDPPKHLIFVVWHSFQLPGELYLVRRYSVSFCHWTHAPDNTNCSPSIHCLSPTVICISELIMSQMECHELTLICSVHLSNLDLAVLCHQFLL